MSINVKELDPNYDFEVDGVSYVGEPVSNTVMYLTKKVEKLLDSFGDTENCLVFIESTVNVPEKLTEKNCFIRTDNPCLSYTRFLEKLNAEREQAERKRKYTLTEGGYYIGENVTLGKNCYIEPACYIGHDVVIGDNAHISYGAVIKHAVIGNNFYAGEYCNVGSRGYVLCRDENNNLRLIPTLGKVIIGDDVFLGAFDSIQVGTARNTVIGDHSKFDSSVIVGHDSRIRNNVELTCGVIVAGYCDLKDHCFVGLSSTLRNRITIGENSIIGLGAAVIKPVPDSTAVVGNPAKFFSWTCTCGRALNKELVCPECGKHFEIIDDKPVEITD